MKKALLVLFLVGSMLSCKDGDEDAGPGETIFTYRAGLTGNDTNVWLIARDYDTGELLDAQAVPDYQAVTLKTTKKISGNKISLTFFRMTGTGNNRSIYADVYNGVDVGTAWNVPEYNDDIVNDTPTEIIGTYRLSVTDVPSVYALSVSDSFGTISQNMSLVGNSLSGDVSIHEGIEEHFISIDVGSGSPKYALIRNFEPNGNIELSYKHFQAFENVINVPFKKTKYAIVNIYGYTGDYTLYGYNMYDNGAWGFARGDEKSSLNLGFTDYFKNYVVQLSLDDYQYSKRGTAPTSIEYVSSDNFTVTNNTLNGFAATSTIDYLYRTVAYTYLDPGSNIRTTITYYDRPDETKHHDPLTPDIMQQFPISSENLIYNGTSFYVKGQTFEQLLDNRFGNSTPSAASEVGRVFKK